MIEPCSTSTEELFNVNLSESDLARFWAKVNKDGPVPSHMPHLGKCWEWTAARAGGYGMFKIYQPDRDINAHFKAHRISFMLCFGPFERRLLICHACDVTFCLNPTHLFAGTNADNMRDCAKKNRLLTGDRHWTRFHPERLARGDRSGARLHPEKMARGEDQHLSRLTVAKVALIRGTPSTSNAEFARMFGVDWGTIDAARKHKTWKHVP